MMVSVGSNPTPATNIINELAAYRGGFLFVVAAWLPQIACVSSIWPLPIEPQLAFDSRRKFWEHVRCPAELNRPISSFLRFTTANSFVWDTLPNGNLPTIPTLA